MLEAILGGRNGRKHAMTRRAMYAAWLQKPTSLALATTRIGVRNPRFV
jgi:hypothetical protein